MFKRFFSILIFFLLSNSAEGEALRLEVFESADVTVKYEKPLKNIVPKVIKVYPLARATLKKKLRLDLAIKPVIVLVHTDSEFNRMTGGNRLVTAFAVPNNMIVIDFSKMERNPFDLELTLTHELCHLLLHEYVHPYHLPRWLNEGVSQWVSGGISDIINFDGKKLLKQVVLSGNYLPLEDISREFPGGTNRFILAYEESKSFVEYIDEKYGTDNLLLILEKLHQGDNIDKAVFDSLFIAINELEYEWHKYLKRKYTWYLYVADNLLWILFFVASVLTVIGYLKLRVRMKTHFKDEEDDDEYYNNLDI